MKQESFSNIEYSCRKKKTKREEFLEIMKEIIPWEEWVGIIRPYYPAGKRGCPPIEIEIMLRMYLLQCWFSLSDEGVEVAIYDSYAMRKFMEINFFEQDIPDATTLISAPSSTKNAGKKRDPEMYQTKKGNQWYFGMKYHVVYGDSAYLGPEKRKEIQQDPHLSGIGYRINRRPRQLPRVSDNAIDWERYIDNRKSAVRCKVEHPYRIVKNIFGFRKTVYRGLRKNLNRLHVLLVSANLYMLSRAGGSPRPA